MSLRTITLSPDECRTLLSTTSVGRVATTQHGLPAVVPVRYALSDDRLVVQVVGDDDGYTSCVDAVVGFEADEMAGAGHYAWWVVAIGIARPVQPSAAVDARDGATVGGDEPASGGSFTLALDRISGYRVDDPAPGPHHDDVGWIRRTPAAT